MLKIIDVDIHTARLAADIRGKSILKLAEAVVVASALAARADTLLSNDRQVVRVAAEHMRAVFFDDWQP